MEEVWKWVLEIPVGKNFRQREQQGSLRGRQRETQKEEFEKMWPERYLKPALVELMAVGEKFRFCSRLEGLFLL